MKPEPRAWFGPKSGLGFKPVTWEGYVATAAFVVVLAGLVVALRRERPLLLGAVALAVALFVLVGWWKGAGEGGWRKP